MEKKEIDKDILLKAKAGDLYAFEVILYFFEKNIFNYVLRIVKKTEDAQDVTQDTFIKVYKHRESIDIEKNIKTWIFTIATNTAYDFLRSKKRKNETSLDQIREQGIETTNDLKSYYKDEGIEYDIEKALEKINVVYKNALVLFFQQGFEYKEISVILDIPINTVKTHIMRGKEQLKEQLKSYGKN